MRTVVLGGALVAVVGAGAAVTSGVVLSIASARLAGRLARLLRGSAVHRPLAETFLRTVAVRPARDEVALAA